MYYDQFFFYLSFYFIFFLSEQYLNLYYYKFDQNKWEKFAVWNLRLFYEGVKVLKEREQLFLQDNC